MDQQTSEIIYQTIEFQSNGDSVTSLTLSGMGACVSEDSLIGDKGSQYLFVKGLPVLVRLRFLEVF